MKIEDILSSLPSKEEIADALAGRTHNTGGDVLTALGIFGTGMLLGAGLALLLTPKSGQDLRRDLVERLNEVGHKLGNGGEESSAATDHPS